MEHGPWHSNKNTPLSLLPPAVAWSTSQRVHCMHMCHSPDADWLHPPWSACKLRMVDAVLWPCGL